jgi:hypothetical protein
MEIDGNHLDPVWALVGWEPQVGIVEQNSPAQQQ